MSEGIARQLQQALDHLGITSAVRPETSDDTPLGVTAYSVRLRNANAYDVIRIGLAPDQAERLIAFLTLESVGGTK